MKFGKIVSISIFFVSLAFYVFADNGGTNTAEEDKINWLTIEEAQKKGKNDPRKVFVDVYTDWCGWCKRMDKTTFSDDNVVEYVNDNYYAVKLNAESKNKITFNGMELTEQELARAFRVSGYPTIVFIDETFQKITPLPGYRQAEEFKNILIKFDNDQLQ